LGREPAGQRQYFLR